ncbi:MAG: hypothetical protein DMG65_00175 [Candidatus Angelobacter sp. Gp1-AA117]|nr:MAG: hypothetical protein DMG65_00175 [Candidatus Angelobacter sp. Gp1-AA117]
MGKIDNHKQESWKLPLPQFIEELYFKRFGRTAPCTRRKKYGSGCLLLLCQGRGVRHKSEN